MNNLINYTLFLADTTLVLAQRNSEWCGHGPILEQDIALTNIALDLLGQARNFYQYAATQIGNNATEDSLAYWRTEREFKNLLLVELPNNHWGQTILRQFFFSTYQLYLFKQLQNCQHQQIAAIATKALKEIVYHVRWSSEWVIRLGNGTSESHKKMLQAIDELKNFVGEAFILEEYETIEGVNMNEVKNNWQQKIKEIFTTATLPIFFEEDVNTIFQQIGGKKGVHTEHLGYLLAEMQYLQKTYPNAQW